MKIEFTHTPDGTLACTCGVSALHVSANDALDVALVHAAGSHEFDVANYTASTRTVSTESAKACCEHPLDDHHIVGMSVHAPLGVLPTDAVCAGCKNTGREWHAYRAAAPDRIGETTIEINAVTV